MGPIQKRDGFRVISFYRPVFVCSVSVKPISRPGRFFLLTFRGATMDKTEQQALQVTKEIMVKFIEVGRISPTNFSEHFANIYTEVLRTVLETSTTEACVNDTAPE